jgi:hypothetical protein
MTEQQTGRRDAVEKDQPPNGLAVGLSAFAGWLMITVGGLQMIQGIVALFDDEFYVTTPNYVVQLDTTTWGWTHLLLGLIVLGAGLGVLAGQVWGRTVGVVLAVLSVLANFAFIPYYPFWALTIIALDIFVIWALTVHGREIAAVR